MSKFTRVMKFREGYHTISHGGEIYTEDSKGTGIFEAPHAAADYFRDCGFAEDFASDMEEAKVKLAPAPKGR